MGLPKLLCVHKVGKKEKYNIQDLVGSLSI